MNKMIKCKACGKEIASGAKCPECGKDSRNFFMKHKVLTIILAIFIFAGIGSAIGSSKDEGNENVGGNQTSTDTKKTSEQELKDSYAIGEEVKLKDNVLVVNSIEKTSGSEWDKPKDGHEFVIVNVTIKNGGSSEITYNPFDFSMQNSNGQITEQTFTTVNNDTQLNSGKLASNGSVTGTIVFEQPVGDTGLVLKYKSNMFSSKEVKVNLN